MTGAPRAVPLLLTGCLAAAAGLPARTSQASDPHDDEEAVAFTNAALDFEYVTVAGGDLEDGAGGTFRLGREFAGRLSLTPEIGVGYHSLDGVHGASLFRSFAGLRLGIATVIEPGIFGHLGYGHIEFRNVSGSLDRSHGAFLYDAGIALDYRVLPRLGVGVHAAYNGLKASYEFGAVHFISGGAHASLRFGGE